MKEAKKSTEKEPTIRDVMEVVGGLVGKVDSLTKRSDSLAESLQEMTEAVQTGFARQEEILTRHEEMLAGHGEMLDKHDRLLKVLVEGQNNLVERVGDMDRRLIATQSRVEDIADMFESTTDVVDESRDQLFSHEVRIKRLEGTTA